MHYIQTDPEPFYKYVGRNLKELFFSGHNDGDHGWGTEMRQKIYLSACKYMNVDPYVATNIFGVGLNSMFQSDYLEIQGLLLENIKQDSGMLAQQKKVIIDKIELDPYYRVGRIDEFGNYEVQFGGQRSKAEMWKQLLEVHKWSTEHHATWDVALNELTWTVRTTKVYVDYSAEIDGVMTLHSNFEDTLDLRPSWNTRSMEYNAACVVLGFMYHDILGGSDELKTKAKWTTVIQPK